MGKQVGRKSWIKLKDYGNYRRSMWKEEKRRPLQECRKDHETMVEILVILWEWRKPIDLKDIRIHHRIKSQSWSGWRGHDGHKSNWNHRRDGPQQKGIHESNRSSQKNSRIKSWKQAQTRKKLTESSKFHAVNTWSKLHKKRGTLIDCTLWFVQCVFPLTTGLI